MFTGRLKSTFLVSVSVPKCDHQAEPRPHFRRHQRRSKLKEIYSDCKHFDERERQEVTREDPSHQESLTVSRQAILHLGSASALSGLAGPAIAVAEDDRLPTPTSGFSTADLLKPCKSLEPCEATLQELTAALEKQPDELELQGYKYFYETEVERLTKNKVFVSKLRQDVENGSSKFLQHAVVSVPQADFDKAIEFWTKGMAMEINRTRTDEDGLRTVFVSYGPETLKAENGGNFALELVESPSPSQPAWLSTAPQLAYIQLAIGNVRFRNIVDSGAEIVYSYGYLEIIAPGGLLVKQRVGARRDPIELLAFDVPDVEKASKFYQSTIGMTAEVVPEAECEDVGRLGGIFGKKGEGSAGIWEGLTGIGEGLTG
ncbi:hypothetical protein CYMTET_55396 [Cymbomonas tetramitiformis]|uniref:Uncharacterized protein n=1 Tax=Cymbomonas tetramitiformis TaxID=36881 RepID=A0AAE0BEF0_9CHLO|nr:hypothetical protein CYMTET_55396 [Cymbomonas tetramitiformis]